MMTGSDALESPRPTRNVYGRPSPQDERPSQRLRRDDGSQITQRLTADDHPIPYVPFSSPPLSRSILRLIPGRNGGKEALPRDPRNRKAARSGAISRIDAMFDSSRDYPVLTATRLMEMELNKRRELCGDVDGDAHDDLGTEIAPYPSGYSGRTVRVGFNASDNARNSSQGVTGSTPRMVAQQSANRSWDEGVPASSSHSLACSQQRYSSLQANPYHFDQSAPPEPGLFNQHPFAFMTPTIAGPSTANYTSATSYSQARSFNHHLDAGSGTYLDPRNASSMAKSLSTSDIPSMAAVPLGFSGLPASTSGTWDNSRSAQAMHAFAASRPPPVNARLGNTRTALGVTTSNAQGSHEIPPPEGSIPRLRQSGVTSPVITPWPQPALFTSMPMRPVTKSFGHDLQTTKASESSAGGPSGGPVAEGSANGERRTVEDDTKWVQRSAGLTALAKGILGTCKLPEGVERVEAFRSLRRLFKAMFDLCYNDDHYFEIENRLFRKAIKRVAGTVGRFDHELLSTLLTMLADDLMALSLGQHMQGRFDKDYTVKSMWEVEDLLIKLCPESDWTNWRLQPVKDYIDRLQDLEDHTGGRSLFSVQARPSVSSL